MCSTRGNNVGRTIDSRFWEGCPSNPPLRDNDSSVGQTMDDRDSKIVVPATENYDRSNVEVHMRRKYYCIPVMCEDDVWLVALVYTGCVKGSSERGNNKSVADYLKNDLSRPIS